MTAGLFSFAPVQGVLRQLRADVRAAAAALGASGHACDAAALVVDEIVNNAIEHGAAYRRRGLDLSLGIGVVAGRLQVEFHDPEMPNAAVEELATALAAAGNGMPSLESERGRGLFLLSVYLDDLRADIGTGGGLRLRGHMARD